MNTPPLTRLSEAQARELLESLRWPHGPACPHCANVDQERITKLTGKGVRTGLYRCKECRKHFTVTVGTVMHRSKIGLSHWMYAVARMAASKKGISALQLKRELSCSYETAWFLCHRIRFAMREGLDTPLTGIVEVDECFIGGKRKFHDLNPDPKMPVVAMVERGGRSRSTVMPKVSPRGVLDFMDGRVDKKATHLFTDEFHRYRPVGKTFLSHERVHHGKKEFARKHPAHGSVHTNTVECWHSLLKRGIIGAWHQISHKHLQRYVDEFDFRWSTRKITDHERSLEALKQIGGKRLMYKDVVAKVEPAHKP